MGADLRAIDAETLRVIRRVGANVLAVAAVGSHYSFMRNAPITQNRVVKTSTLHPARLANSAGACPLWYLRRNRHDLQLHVDDGG